VIIAAVVVGPSLSNFFENGQAATALPALDDNTSPEILMARREQEEARLNSYGWIDKEAGVVRIPIDRAMALIVESGLPVGRVEPATPTPEPSLPPTNTPTPETAREISEAGTPTAGEPSTVTAVPASTSEPSGEETLTPEPSPTASPAPTIDLAEVSFQAHVLPILEQNCVKCHGGERPEGGLRVEEGLTLKTYESILAGSWNGPVIEPGNVPDSYLIEQIATGRMPKDEPRLSPAEIEIITAWVEAGAPNN
jgi:mono/diheme cytochrome c family protein